MIKVFFSYSHKDESYRDELEKHLMALKRHGDYQRHQRRCQAAYRKEPQISRNTTVCRQCKGLKHRSRYIDSRSGITSIKQSCDTKPFTDHERDSFISESFEYIARFFEGSLNELQARNPDVKTRFQRVDARSFEAFAYRNGNQVCKCGIWLSDSFGSRGPSTIAFCYSGVSQRNSFNEIMSVKDNGNILGLEPMGMRFHYGEEKKRLTFEGAAEYYWSMFFEPMQRGH